MQIFYDNIIFSLQKAGGISVYWYELLKRSTNEFVFCFETKNENIFGQKLNIFSKKERNLSIKILRYLPFTKKLPSQSIFHSSYYRTIFQKDVAKIITIYDFTYEIYCGGLQRFIHSFQKKIAIQNADGIICISNSTKNDLFKFLPNTPNDKVRTIHISASEEFYPLDKIRINLEETKFENLKDKKIILYVGDRKSSYKNFILAVETTSLLVNHMLVSVGGGNITEKETALLDRQLKNRFVHFSNITSSELNLLYNIAFCLLYPSSYEGFGIPIIEAMKAGCPVVSTDFSSIPEIAGDAALLVDKIDVENFVQKIKELENPNVREKLIEIGLRQAELFSWDKCFDETHAFYKEIWDKKFT